MHPILVLNPRSDLRFSEYATECADEAQTPGELEACLRERYPQAVVRRRDLEGESLSAWYVYRDGRWRSGDESGVEG